MADVNGDGKSDIVGFADRGVLVALSTGTQFSPASLWTKDYSYLEGWQVGINERILADVNYDGKDDVVATRGSKTFISLSTGQSFAEPKIQDGNTLKDIAANNVDCSMYK